MRADAATSKAPLLRRLASRDAMWLALIAVVLAVALGRHRLLSASVDVAYHLQELELVRDTWLVGEADKGWLSELWWYPKLSHRAAAWLTTVAPGDLDALTTLSVASAAAAWACLLGWARRAGAAVLAGGAALALVFGLVLGAMYGAEAVVNFFYPQLVGEGVAWLMLTALVVWTWRRRWAFAIGATAAVALSGCIHLLPTLHLAASLMALAALHGVRVWLRERRVLVADLAAVLAAPAALVLNPFFGAMRMIAGNDGAITLTRTVSFPLLGAASALLLALSAAVLLRRLLARAPDAPAGRAAEVLAAVGAGVAAAALMQLLTFLLLHDGSAYAVRKHGFGVFTLLAFIAPLCAVELWRSAPAALRARAPAWAAPLALVVVMAAVFAKPSVVDVPDTQRLLADVRRLRPAADLHGASTLFASDTVMPVVTYMATIAMLQATHGDPNVLDLIWSGQPGRPEAVPHIVTRVGDAYDKPACREGAPVGSVVQVRGDCAAAPSVSFAAGAPGAAMLRNGWAAPEKGVWSDGDEARLDLAVPPEARGRNGAWLQVYTFAFTPPESPRRTVTLLVDGAPVETFTYDRAAALTHAFTAHVSPEAARRGRVAVGFRIADPVSPTALGLGADTRALGVGLERIRVTPDNQR